MLIKGEGVAHDELHLLGGLRAATHQDGYLIVYPTMDQ